MNGLLPCAHGSGESAAAGTLRFHDLLVRQAPPYLQRFGTGMPPRQRQVLERIVRCRTPALGGQLFRCPACRTHHYRYHSCNDRHCPQCGQTDALQWLAAQRQRLLLPVNYFLVTFTVAQPLRDWIRSHPKLGYEGLFAASARALQELGRNPKRLGAQLGMLGVLHTWSRTLIYHPHIHYLVPGGGLSPDQCRWVSTKQPSYLLNEYALGERCRNLFHAQLREQAPEQLQEIGLKGWKQRWVVDCRPVGGGEAALTYLSRYVFKTATANRRVQVRSDGRVSWPYRDSATGQWQHLNLEPQELVRRFLQHVLPKGFTRIRLFGWLAPAARQKLNRVRALLGQGAVLTPQEKQVWLEQQEQLEEPAEPALDPPSPTPLPQCPRCGQPMRLVTQWRGPTQAPSLANPRAPP